ncbi:MAG: hypothetical protein CMP20_02680 [Rickettsiales bacterium]|nr:hypothetical protein [Rickettsiales bacterium]
MNGKRKTEQFSNGGQKRSKDVCGASRSRETFSLDQIIVSYDDGVEAVLDCLREFGCVRVDNVYSAEKCQTAREGIVAFMEGLGTGYQHSEDRANWEASRDLLPPQTRDGMMQALVSCIPEVCSLHKSKALRSIFAQAYGTQKLIASADGINWAPPMDNPPTKRWDHLDQSTPGVFNDIQGAINLNTCDAGTVVWPKSHLFFEDLLREFEIDAKDKSNWIMLAKDDEKMAIAQRWVRETPGAAEAIAIPSVEGSVTLWLSSCIHAACAPTTAWRYVHYLSFRPAEEPTGDFGLVIDAKAIKRRANVFRSKRHTNHWASKMMPKKPGFWRTYLNKPYVPLIMEYLDDPTKVPGTLQTPSKTQKRLYGLEPYSEPLFK